MHIMFTVMHMTEIKIMLSWIHDASKFKVYHLKNAIIRSELGEMSIQNMVLYSPKRLENL